MIDKYVHFIGDGVCKILSDDGAGAYNVKWLVCPPECPETPGHIEALNKRAFRDNITEIMTEKEFEAWKILNE